MLRLLILQVLFVRSLILPYRTKIYILNNTKYMSLQGHGVLPHLMRIRQTATQASTTVLKSM